jgi:hypothetical protein
MSSNKTYREYTKKLDVRLESRQDIRKKIVMIFLSEKPGYIKDGVQHNTRYRYYVEELKDGRSIYLLKPTYLNKGFDFQVWVEKLGGAKDKRPSHGDILNDVQKKIIEKPEKKIKLSEVLDKIWKCEDPDEVLSKFDLEYSTGYEIELLLKVLKWLFIEQDITYWNYSGRNKLRKAIHNIIT